MMLAARPALAQTSREGRLLVTVVDQSNAIIPGATVSVTGVEDATRTVTPVPAQTEPSGLATIPRLALGRYTVRAEFPGFDAGTLKDVRVRAGDNRHVVVLAIQKMEETVNVGQDAQAGAADRRSNAFGTAMTREQMDALSDDPDEMQRQLQDMAGPGAVLRIDSFEGGRLPPKAMIKAIHITREQTAAENHNPEGFFIDIITQPGVGPIRTNFNYQLHNSAMSARNAFTPTKGSDQNQNYGININGGLIKNKASFSLSLRGNSAFDTPNLFVVRSTGTHTEALTLKSPRGNMGVYASFDYAVTRDQTLRMSYNQNDSDSKNLGVGGFNEIERAFDTENHQHTFRIQEAGPIGRRLFTNTRLNVGWSDSDSHSVLEARTIRVLDAQTTGGAQVAGGRHSRDMNLASDLDYVRGIHSVRVGTAVDGNWYRSDDTSNYLGTYTFEDYAAFLAGAPRSYTQRIGDPRIRYFNMQAAFYAQDDIRVRRSLTFTPGVRYEVQTHVKDYGNIGPRFGVTWAPFKNGKTTIRSSWGIFYDWLMTNTYEQTLRVDGFRQRELNVLNPPFPDPSGGISTITPVNRYLLDPELQNVKRALVSGGIDYAFNPRTRVNLTYRYLRGIGLLRGQNLNAPVNGLRPDQTFGNVVQVVSDGRSRLHGVQLSGQSAPPAPPGGQTGPLWSWKRVNFFGFYGFTVNENNVDGAFSTPATGSLAAEWGPAPGSAIHRIQSGFNIGMLRNLNAQFNFFASSGTPYTIVTGRDENGDLIFNDRQVGVGRNTARTTGQWQVNSFFSYGFTFGPRIQLPGGINIFGGPGGLSVINTTPPEQGRYRISFNASVQNLTNHTNLMGYIGTMTSPLFGLPTMAQNARRIDVGMTLGF
jgi:hypothetical protein